MIDEGQGEETIHRFLEEREAVLAVLSAQPSEVPEDCLQPLIQSPLPLTEKYHEIDACDIIRSNAVGQPPEFLRRISTALNILEKYGRNLLNPQKPKFWRAVKFNNPVFRSTVDAITGGRQVLRLYGYTEEQADGMSFPQEVEAPDVLRVASVTVDILLLRLELNLLISNMHPHPENFSKLLQRGPLPEAPLVSDSVLRHEGVLPGPADPQSFLTQGPCMLCGGEEASVHCPVCNQILCSECDRRLHQHPSRAQHHRLPVPKRRSRLLSSPLSTSPCSLAGDPSVTPSPWVPLQNSANAVPFSEKTAPYWRSLGSEALPIPGGSAPRISATWDASITRTGRPPWHCACCRTVNEARAVLCVCCDKPRGYKGIPDQDKGLSGGRGRWSCQTCTFENEAAAILCAMCDRPRLARGPSLSPGEGQPESILQVGSPKQEAGGWECNHCTFWNTAAGRVCKMCDRSRNDVNSTAVPGANSTQDKGLDFQCLNALPLSVSPAPCEEVERLRQERLREDGQRLVNMIRVGEAFGLQPEEVFCAVQYSGTEVPVHWLQTELPFVLETVVELAAQTSEAKDEAAVGAVTQEEAKRAWLACEGNIEEAAQYCARERKKKMQEIRAVGFTEQEQVLQALYMNAGDVNKAVTDLQRQLLAPFHTRLWQEQELQFNFSTQDKQALVRRVLAVYSLPSWGRAELVVSLMQEQNRSYELQDIVEAVRQSHDKEFIRRMLAQECAVCSLELPRNRMQSLTSCECTICPECFKMHFTIAVKEKHIKDMVCPSCNEPEISDEAELLNYFSTLDILLRDCLDPDVYNLFHKKLTERVLMKDPKFLWCTHCSFGFIYEREQLEVKCPQCRKSFCITCKRPWEEQHQGISCEAFQEWKRKNDPQYQVQGLAMYLQENGIACPNCKFSYSLARGGCMHFKCSQCRHEFCSGCYNTFHAKNKCSLQICPVRKSLHAHHPRDCLFYLRDWDVGHLQRLLQTKNTRFNTDPPAGTQLAPGGGCRVMEQKETLTGLKDEPCGKETPMGYAGLCQSHYKEYLVRLINSDSLDPVLLYDLPEAEIVCKRYLLAVPQRAAGEDDRTYRTRLLKKLTEEVGLGENIPRKKIEVGR
ncbi:E3 ubiquitin-protein ligase RNF31 isoform X2 [Microcaecilia unicolor]|uniref:RanBP-type and C3HC4-type zinc finger-containing protein 1 n=1 Tax=Microcaecilia unicolor TaxID=1415580 RepID=A0A6P7WS04_9AMPH|nr:E3 ubiquitin-protein ligase RNF31 isoform X2 [Microcaecilia unicolor]